jgi:hypothetical protein
MRICPAMEAEKAKDIMVKKLTENLPYNAKITANVVSVGNGWLMKKLSDNF